VSWRRILGHEAIVTSLARAVAGNRLGHAYLFSGPAGAGKKTLAIELAKALLCEGSGKARFNACDQCHSCAMIEAGTHPDYQLVGRPADKVELPIETIREMSEFLTLKPARGDSKVAILDDADDLSIAAANSLLKTLEEPPTGTVLILISTAAEVQLTTIVSRCQVVRFHPVPTSQIEQWLRSQDVDPAQVQRLARMSGGCPGQALELAEPTLWNFRAALLEHLSNPSPDAVAFAKKWVEFVEEAGSVSGPQRRRTALCLKLVIDLLDNALRASVGAPDATFDADEARAADHLAKRLGTDRLLTLTDRCLEASKQNDMSVQLVLVIESLVDSWSQAVR
jgi:DNA polymerase-3 subunit delta'